MIKGKFKKLRINKKVLIEIILVTSTPIIWGVLSYFPNYRFSVNSLIDTIFILDLVILFLIRVPHPRHIWIAIFFLVASAVTSAFYLSSLTFLFSGLTLTFFILGVINLIFFPGPPAK